MNVMEILLVEAHPADALLTREVFGDAEVPHHWRASDGMETLTFLGGVG